jgi:serine protease
VRWDVVAVVGLGTWLSAAGGPIGAQAPGGPGARGLLPVTGSGSGAPTSGQAARPLQTNPPPLAWVGLTAERTQEFIDAKQQGLNYLPGEVLVKFKSPVSTAGQQRALMALRSRPDVSTLRWEGEVQVLHDVTQPDARVLADQLRSQPEVEYAEPNYLRHHMMTPNDPGFTSHQWNFTAINVPQAWDINAGASGIIVAVVDTGVTTVNQTITTKTWNGSAIISASIAVATNPDLSVSRLVSPFDFVTGMGTTVIDTDGHGSHVSSTIGEDTNNNLNEAGIAYKAQIMPVKVCTSYWDVQFSMSLNGIAGFAPIDAGDCPDSAIASGIRYAADNGAKVINVSLGGTDQSTALQSALTYAVGKGAFIAIAGGNEYLTGNPVEYPAAYAQSIGGVMSVGAVGKSLRRASYSNTGSWIEIVAPGGDSADSDASGSGYIWQSTLRPSDSDPTIPGLIIPRFDRYTDVGYTGTSMATPHVVGTAALLMSQAKLTPAQVETLIEKTAQDLGTAGRDNDFGYGLIQPRLALRGFGLIR